MGSQDNGSLIVNGIRIHPSVLRKDAVYRCATVPCLADCCSGGVWLKDEEVPRIREWADAVKECLPPDRHDDSKWFEPGKDETGTSTVDDPLRPNDTCCIFLQSDRKCALQVVSQKFNLGWPGLKPFYCATYPLYIVDGVMMMDDETPINPEFAMCRRCAPEQRAMYEVHRDEAILILGEDGYRELLKKQTEE